MMLALLVASMAWGWHRRVMSLLLGFYGRLRLCEILLLQVRDDILQTSSGAATLVIVVIRSAKTRFQSARHLYVMIDFLAKARFRTIVLLSLTPAEFIFSGSAWRRVCTLPLPPEMQFRVRCAHCDRGIRTADARQCSSCGLVPLCLLCEHSTNAPGPGGATCSSVLVRGSVAEGEAGSAHARR